MKATEHYFPTVYVHDTYLPGIHRTPLALRCVCTIPTDEPGCSELLYAGTSDIGQQSSGLCSL